MILTWISPIRLGSGYITFTTSATAPSMSVILSLLLTIPMVVSMQAASAVATKSVGENASHLSLIVLWRVGLDFGSG